MLLYGKNSVCERLRVNPKSIKKIFLQENFKDLAIEEFIKNNSVASIRVSEREMFRIKPGAHSQGIVASVCEFIYASFDEMLRPPLDRKTVLLFLDRIYDPQNLGSIIRTAACFGSIAIVLPKYKACAVTETVLHVAQGGENYVPIALVTNLKGAILKAKQLGFWIMGAFVDSDADELSKISIPFPLGVVLGSEGEGIRYGVGKHLDMKAKITMSEARLSLNVATACAVLCYEAVKQRSAIHEKK